MSPVPFSLAIWERVRRLARGLRDGLSGLPGVAVHDRGVERCAIVTFTKDGEPPAALARRLRGLGINISTSTMPFARLDLEPRGLPALARASVHYYNTEAEIARFCEAVERRG